MVTLSVNRHFKARCVEVQQGWLKGRVTNPVTKSVSLAKMELSGFYPDQLVIRSKMSSNYNDSLIGKFFFSCGKIRGTAIDEHVMGLVIPMVFNSIDDCRVNLSQRWQLLPPFSFPTPNHLKWVR